MDIFLLLPSCGWCVNQSYFIFSFLFFFLFQFSGCNLKISFSFSWVASLGIRPIFSEGSISNYKCQIEVFLYFSDSRFAKNVGKNFDLVFCGSPLVGGGTTQRNFEVSSKPI